MKTLMICLTFLCLAACQGGEEGAEDSVVVEPQHEPPVLPRPAVEPEPIWGELQCQQQGDCDNPVLLVEHHMLIDLLTVGFSAVDEEQEGSLEQAFFCGIDFTEFWQDLFPEAQANTQDEFNHITDFGKSVLDLPTCQLKPNLLEQLKQYFYRTEEFRNETSK